MGETYTIHESSDYGAFKLDPCNRPVREKHLKEIVHSIERKNLLMYFPIVVLPDGTIRDGQHRFCAAKELNVPFYYIISTEMTLQDVSDTSQNQSGWKSQDHLHHYCSRGYPGYIAIREFWRRYNWMTLEMATRICYIGNHGALHEVFDRGEYAPNALRFGSMLAEACLDFKPYITYYNQISFMQTMRNLLQNKNYQHDRMVRKLKGLSSKLRKCPDVASYLAVMEDIYNYRESEQNKVHFRKLTTSSPEYVQAKKDSEFSDQPLLSI